MEEEIGNQSVSSALICFLPHTNSPSSVVDGFCEHRNREANVQMWPFWPPSKLPLWCILKLLSHFLWYREGVQHKPLHCLPGRFAEIAKTSPQLGDDCSQGPLTTLQQNLPNAELRGSIVSHQSWLNREPHATPGPTKMLQALTNKAPDCRPCPLSSFLIRLSYFISYTVVFWC